MSVRATVLGLSVMGMGLGTSAEAAIVEFRNTTGNAFVANYTGAEDNELYGYGTTVSTWNSGAVTNIQIGTGVANQPRKALIRFTNLGVMSGQYTSITSAKLILRNYSTSPSSAFDVGVYQVSDANADWVEGTKQFAAAGTGESSWTNKAGPSTAWAGGSGLAAGGLTSPGSDYVATALDTTTVNYNTPGSTTWEWDLPPSLVNQWITGGTNGGLLVQKVSESDASYWSFESSETSVGPRLVIDYTPIPEPVGLGTAVAAGGALFFRRPKANSPR